MSNIFQAIRLNEVEVYNELIRRTDINFVNDDKSNMLHIAIAYSNTDIGIDLIKRGIDVNHSNKNGQTPLHSTAFYGNIILAKAILENGGNPNILDIHGNNPLWTAVFNARGKYELVKLYRQYDADAYSKNKSNRSPMDFAKQIEDEILVAVLELTKPIV